MKRKVIIGLIIVIALGILGFIGYKVVPSIVNKEPETQTKEEREKAEIEADTEAMVNSYEQGEKIESMEPLSDSERAKYKELYDRYSETLSKKITITENDIAEAEKEGVQYPAYKLTVKDGTSTREVFLNDIEDSETSVGAQSEYGEVISCEPLSESDKRNFLESMLYNKKLANILYKEVKSRE